MAMYLNAIINFFNWNGRLNRRQFFLIVILTLIPALILLGILFSIMKNNNDGLMLSQILLLFIYSLLMIPSRVKRLHDMNHSGWFLFWVYMIGLIPGLNVFIDPLFTLMLLLVSGDENKNQYGDLPEKDAKILSEVINKERKSAVEAIKLAPIVSIKKISDTIAEFKGTQSDKEKEIQFLKQKIQDLEIQKLEKRIQDLENQLKEK